MFPDIVTAEKELETAGSLNPGLWTAHSKNVARAASLIAEACGMNTDEAFVAGLLHDIGRRNGVSALKHTIDGYDYCTSKGWNEIARVCLTHSFPVKDATADIGKVDIAPDRYEFIKKYISEIDYDDLDKLIILCDALADANGFCILEKRFVDTTRRYGIYPFTLDRWNKTIEYKDYFEKKAGKSLYALLPGIENCIYL